jgi:hypothetical protein
MVILDGKHMSGQIRVIQLWSPTIKGYKRCKDDGYVLRGFSILPDLMLEFVQAFEVSINEL